MSETNSSADSAEPGSRPSWLGMQPAEFNTDLPVIQGALFAEPDRLGTAPLFGDAFGTTLALPPWITSQWRAAGTCERCGERPAATEWAGTGELICWRCCDAKRAAGNG